MLKKRLELLVSGLEGFERPNPRLEQYKTDSRLAATLAWLAAREAPGSVLDLGCGTGVLLYAVQLLVEAYGVCLDIDESALRVARRNAERLGLTHLVDLVQADALHPPLRECSFDLTVMNPPFGMRSRRGLDAEFLRVAGLLSRRVYSIHAYSDGLLDALRRKTGLRVEEVARDYIMIPAFLEEHRRRVHRVKVSLVVAEGCRRG